MQTALYVSTGSPGSAADEKGRGIGVAIGLAVVVIVVLLCIAIYLYYAKCVKGRRRANNQSVEPPENGHEPVESPEKQVLLPAPNHPKLREGPRNPQSAMTELPEANMDLDERSNRGSIEDRRLPASASPPPPYAPTVTPPPTPGSTAVSAL